MQKKGADIRIEVLSADGTEVLGDIEAERAGPFLTMNSTQVYFGALEQAFPGRRKNTGEQLGGNTEDGAPRERRLTDFIRDHLFGPG